MDKKSAIHLIESTFNAKFSEEQFTVFAKNLLNDLEQGEKVKSYSGNYIWDDYKEHINSYKRIGKYIDPNGEALDVLIIQVESSAKLERARTTLRNFVIKHLDKFEKDYALVAFYSQEDDGVDWRFSFVKLEHQSYFDEEKGKVKNKKEFTPAKRYSFLVGEHEKSHTAKNQILPLLQNVVNNPTVEQLEDTFSIERVTDEFFEQYKDLYNSLYAHFENDEHTRTALEQANIENERFTKKLLGQIVFLYFLQKKGWLGVPKNEPWGKGKKNFIQELYTQSEHSGTNFFKEKLQFLFYEALAKERDNENSYYSKFDCRIPFLNGGLFEADYKWREANITIPSRLFRNQDKNKSGDIGTGVLDVFDRYNFTIKEDEPLDKEVAVDPEMLGKVFENMLPENERKGKGAFYTPREIVHYMCQESLIHYLENSVGDKVPNEDIEAFIRNGHLALENDIRVADKGESRTYKYQLPLSIRENAELIDQKLCNVRICDPAIGSGAFPVGLLHEIVTAMLILKPHFSLDYMKTKLDGFGFTMSENIKESRYVYRLKRHIIQESIYGVDIDPSAIDIARLRLWLSLVVDEDDLDPIETLPNLDYKIVTGNSLIGLPSSAMRNLQVESELERLKERFYSLTDELEKKNLRQQINSKIRELLDSAEQFSGYYIDFDFKLFFSEVWREKKGFDIVIGNPPYGSELKDGEKQILKTQFAHLVERIRNSFLYFMGVGESICNPNGNVAFIIPNEFLFQVYMGKARTYFLKQRKMKLALNIGESAFKAIVPTCIIMFEKSVPKKDYEFRIEDFRTDSLQSVVQHLQLSNLKKANSRTILNTPNSTYSFSPERAELVNRISSDSIRFESFCEDIANGISTGHDSVYIISPDFAETKEFEDKYLKPTIKGKDFSSFLVPKLPPKYLLYIDRDFNSNEAPRIYNYLKEHKDSLISKSVEKKKGTRPWELLFRSRYVELFESPKIIFRQTGDSIICACDKLGYFSIDSTNIAKLKPASIDLIDALVGVLNTEVVNFYYREISQEGGRVLAQVKPTRLRSLPIPKTIDSNRAILSEVTAYLELLKATSNKLQFEFFLQVLNCVTYELFFYEEVHSSKKQIIAFLEDIKTVRNENSIESKLAVIKSEFERLHGSNNPVRNVIETIDSVSEVRIIKESLR